MAAIDYEKEYDNRGNVPEHPEIFARWARETEAYRKAAAGAELAISYGPSPRQTLDIFPARNGGKKPPLAMFIHGGWWRSLDPSMFSQMAIGPNANGVTVAVAGYDLVPHVTVATITEQMRAAALALWRRYGQRIMVYGHSAGGHLTACMVATDWTKLASDAPQDLVPAGYAISGVFDLDPILKVTPNQDIRLTAETARTCSPLTWRVPPGRTLDAVVGALESSEFLRQSRTIVEKWKNAAKVRYEEVPDTNHFTVVDALTDPDSAMTKRVVELAKQAAAMPL
ncbi:MAG TPA: alpha/beta hydrolase [Pseudolabrys sp.]|nr:alpha/beta hydrolase [Pseudolabrys sp.]